MNEEKVVKREERFRLESAPGPSSNGDRDKRRENTIGILRLDFGKPRRSSGSSVEFRTPGQLAAQGCAEPTSPQPSVDRLSVTFVDEPQSVMDKVRFQADHVPSDAEEDEDYSQSVSAIFQRKASTRRSRKRRRSSSPLFAQDVEDAAAGLRNRRRSSVFTTSSGETAISVEDAVQEQILQTIKLHKEVLSSVKQQPWNMRRKLRLVRQAQAYIRRHEGELQERLAQSRSTKDILARANIVIVKHWQHTKRELANLMNVLIPWEIRIKEIESHFGSVVASYFTFLRWLFWVNLVTAVVLIVFVAVPEMLMANTKKAGMRKKMLEDEKANATNLFTLWDFEGVLKYSPLFYGYYSHQDPEEKSLAKSIGYTMPLAYFLTELVVYIYSFVAILRRMAENSRQSKLSEKDDECVFTWKLFTGWDYMIGNSETAHNRTASIILGFKEALLEEAEKKRDEGRNWKVTTLRVFGHLNVLWLLGSSVYAVVLVVERSTQPEAEHGWWRKNEITIVVSLITTLYPAVFEALGIMEQYHPRKKLRMQLARIMALNLLNLYTLIFASFSKINEMSNTLQAMRPKNISNPSPHLPSAAFQVAPMIPNYAQDWNSSSETLRQCRNITVPCSSTQAVGTVTTVVSLLAAASLSIASSSSGTPTPPSLSPFATGFPQSDLNLSVNNSTKSVPFSDVSSFNRNYSIDDNFFSTESYTELSPTENGSDDDFFEFLDVKDNNDSRDLNLSTSDNYWNLSSTTDISTEDFNNTLATVVPENDDYDDSLTTLEDFTTSFQPIPSNLEKISQVLSSTSTNDPYSPPSSEELCFQIICETVHVTSPDSTATTSTTDTTLPSGLPDPEVPLYKDLTSYIDTLDMDTCKKLRPLCWETMFGREMVKLTVMDLVMTVLSTLMVDFIRAVFVRYMNNCWCWDLEKKFPQYGDFKIAENILHLVNNQGMVWMGMFFSPGLPLINIIKLAIMMYLRSWAVLTCNVPHEVVFRASRSNNFYLALLLTMLFLCVLPVGYAVVWVTPSWHCGPFSNYHRIYHIFTKSLRKALPYKSLHKAFDYIASPGIVIPLLMLLILIIYYLVSLTSALREANNDLKVQLRRERTEERRKMFKLVDKKLQEAENPGLKWRKVLPNFPQEKLSIADIPIDILRAGALPVNGSAKYDLKHQELIEEFMKKAKRMPSGTSEEENGLQDGGDGTDIEQHDSLPYDANRSPQDLELYAKKRKHTKKSLTEGIKTKKLKNKSTKDDHGSVEREDSATSGWSDIPEIRIIQTESAERLDDVDGQSKGRSSSDLIVPSEDQRRMRKKKSKHAEESINKSKNTSGRKKKIRNKHKEKNTDGTEDNIEADESKKRSPKALKKIVMKHKKHTSKEKDEGNISDELTKVQVLNKKKRLTKTETESKLRKTEKYSKQNPEKQAKSNILKNSETVKSSLKNEPQKVIKFKSDTENFESSEGDESDEIKKDNEVQEIETDTESETISETESEEDNSSPNEEEETRDDSEIEEEEEEEEDSGPTEDLKKHTKVQHKENVKSKDNTSEDSVSSQITIKQVEMKRQRTKEEDSNTSEEQRKESKPSKKAMARFKIANVLLKEARRRSSAGLEEK